MITRYIVPLYNYKCTHTITNILYNVYDSWTLNIETRIIVYIAALLYTLSMTDSNILYNVDVYSYIHFVTNNSFTTQLIFTLRLVHNRIHARSYLNC